jgi:hypothetical protein
VTSTDPKLISLINELLPLDEEELLAEIGAASIGETLGVRPSEFGRYIRVGRQWLDTHADELRASLCGNATIEAIRDRLADGQADDIAILADVIATMYGHFPAAAASVVIARRGIDRLCGEASS